MTILKIKMRLVLLILLIGLFPSCKKSGNEPINDPELSGIVGKWQISRHQYSIGGPPIWEDADTNVVLEFNSDLTFNVTSEEALDNKTGVFQLQNDSLIRIYNDDPANVEYISKITLRNLTLTLVPLSPNICIEGCATQYKKIQ